MLFRGRKADRDQNHFDESVMMPDVAGLQAQTMFSIVIPVFNRADLLKETIESVQGQSCSNWECLVVDDGSSDGSVEVAKDYAACDQRIRVYQRGEERKKGASTCRNIGLENARGDYLLFLDSDDILASHCLANRADCAVTYRDCDFLIFPGLIFNNQIYDSDILISTFPAGGDTLRSFMNFDSCWSILNVVWKRSSLIRSRLRWDENLQALQDAQFSIDAILSGMSCKFVEAPPDCFWRQHDQGNIGRWSHSPQGIYNYFYFIERQCRKLEACGLLRTMDLHNVQSLMMRKAANLLHDHYTVESLEIMEFLKKTDCLHGWRVRLLSLYVAFFAGLQRKQIRLVRGLTYRVAYPVLDKFVIGNPVFECMLQHSYQGPHQE